MNLVKKIAVIGALFVSSSAVAQQASPNFLITNISTQWSSDMTFITPNSGHSWANPGNCTALTEYALDPAMTGHKERFATAMAAFLNNKPVYVMVSGCLSSRPRIIAISVSQ